MSPKFFYTWVRFGTVTELAVVVLNKIRDDVNACFTAG